MSKRAVKVGDKIRITDAWSDYYSNGEIYAVLDGDEYNVLISSKFGGIWVCSEEYEIITNEEDDNMTKEKAQVGDLIRIVDSEDAPKGAIFEVVKAYDDLGEWITYVDGKFEDGGQLFFYDTEYVIHRKAGEEDSPKQTRDAFRELQLQVVEGKTPEDAVAISMAELRAEQDAVNPQHYKQGRVEVIDIIEDAVQGADPFEAVCQANVLKYALRYRHKNGVEDLKKAVWYSEKLIEHLDAKSTQ